MTSPILHTLTPGDHFSPRTGSAIPTVVDGIARADTGVHRVAVAEDTFEPHYDSAELVRYRQAPWPTRRERIVDAARGRIGLSRRAARERLAPIAEAVNATTSSWVLAHNEPAIVELLASHHRPILYAHNRVLRHHGDRELRRLVDRVAGIVCVSDALAEAVAGDLPSAAPIAVVRNGVDCVAFHPAPVRAEGPLRLVFVGRMIADKGADVLVDALTRLGRSDVEIILIGSHGFDAQARLSDYERSLRTKAAACPASVTFQPFVDRLALPEVLRVADVIVVPSRWADPCPLAIGEGMATGVPVVASAIGGIPESLGDGGILVPPADVDALADVLGSLIDDEALRSTWGRRARARAEAADWTATAAALHAALERF